MKKRRRSLNRRIAAIVLILMILMSAGLAFIGVAAIDAVYLRFCHEHTRQIVETVANWTDWDRIRHYAETGEEDDYSRELADFYDSVKRSMFTKSYLVLATFQEDRFTVVYEACLPGDDMQYIGTWGEVHYLSKSSYPQMFEDVQAKRGNQEIALGKSDEGNMLTSWEPILDKNGELGGAVIFQLMMRGIEEEEYAFMLRSGGLLAIFVALSLAMMLWFLRSNVTKPVKKLSAMVNSYERGTPVAVTFRRHDEIRALADSFANLTRRIEAYTGEVARATAEKERIGAELDVAKQIQNDILPVDFPALPERNEFDLFATLEPSRTISGNFYDFFLIDDDHLALVIGDTSDRGVPAALFMVMVKTLIKDRALQGYSPAEVLQNVSEQLLEGNRANMFATVWLAVLELSTGKGVAENAGHWHPVLRRSGKKFEMEKYHHSPPLASMEGVRYRDHGFRLEPGDTLLVYTGGVVETVNEKGELFGESHMLDALNRDPEATPGVLLQTVTSAVHRFSGDMPQSDDRTMLALKYYGTSDEIREKL